LLQVSRLPHTPFDKRFASAVRTLLEVLPGSSEAHHGQQLVALNIFSRVNDLARSLDSVTIGGSTDPVIVHPPRICAAGPLAAAMDGATPPLAPGPSSRGGGQSVSFDAYCAAVISVSDIVTHAAALFLQAMSQEERQAAIQGVMQLLATPDTLRVLIQKPLCRQLQQAAAAGHRGATRCRLLAKETVASMALVIRCSPFTPCWVGPVADCWVLRSCFSCRRPSLLLRDVCDDRPLPLPHAELLPAAPQRHSHLPLAPGLYVRHTHARPDWGRTHGRHRNCTGLPAPCLPSGAAQVGGHACLRAVHTWCSEWTAGLRCGGPRGALHTTLPCLLVTHASSSHLQPTADQSCSQRLGPETAIGVLAAGASWRSRRQTRRCGRGCRGGWQALSRPSTPCRIWWRCWT
jgi:hypothetical protein